MGKINLSGIMVAATLIVLAVSCNRPTKDNDQLILFELPDTVFRQWDDIHDEDYLSLDEDRRFKVEYPDGKILILEKMRMENLFLFMGGIQMVWRP